jgi:hypothetical protein
MLTALDGFVVMPFFPSVSFEKNFSKTIDNN